MFQFLYLFGPGVLTRLVYVRYKQHKTKRLEKEKDKNYLDIVIEIISHSLVNMALTLAILKPFGRVQLVVLADGRMDVHYGVSAILVSIFLAVIIGMILSISEKKCAAFA